MEKRRLGRAGHMSTVAIFGAAAFSQVDQHIADVSMQQVIDVGINHIDVAPGYGIAEKRIGPWMEKERKRFFLGCKTMERSKTSAAAELRRSLNILRIDNFDLYQLHAITTMEELDLVTASGGALEAAVEARVEGLTKHIGITGHGNDVPSVFLEALRRFDFDTILFPINFVQYGIPKYRQDTEELLEICRQRDVGTMIIKALARKPWVDDIRAYSTWYDPFDEPKMIQKCIDFSLSQNVTGLCTSGDVTLLPMFIEACENYQPMSDIDQQALIEMSVQYETIF